MSDREEVITVGRSSVSIELAGNRMWLREGIASGKTEDGRSFEVSTVIGGLGWIIYVEDRRYAIPLRSLIGDVLDIDIELQLRKEGTTDAD